MENNYDNVKLYFLQIRWLFVRSKIVTSLNDPCHFLGFYCPQTKLAKVMFSQVCLPTGLSLARVGLCQGGVSVQRGLCQWSHCPAGSLFSRGVSTQGASVRGVSVQRGSLSGRPPYGKRAGGTHPTGMHSCFLIFSNSHRLFWPG